MSNVVISVEKLSKAYRLGQIGTGTLSRDINVWWAKMRGKPDPMLKVGEPDHGNRDGETIWALKNVSFSVKQGDTLGIIGRNGAGKSTLLKILSQVTAPTSGSVKVKGRIASLLEVGTGFHPDLTGRENIYLNGAIMGMNRQEVRYKLDAIVNFAGIEQFIDTPVKRYSSGMYVRLAFAVASHLDPEILVVDEVLAVGDAEFQKKCLGKMGDVALEGRTVLFVSHNMAVIQKLCMKSLLLNSGEIISYDETALVVSKYLEQLSSHSSTAIVETNESPNRLPKMQSIITKVTLQDQNGNFKTDFDQGEPILLSVYYDSIGRSEGLAGSGFILESLRGVRVGGFNTYMGTQPPYRLPSRGVVHFLIKDPVLTPDHYYLTVSVGPHQLALVDKIEKVIEFDIQSRDIYGTGYLVTKGDGVVAMKCEVSIEKL